MPTVPQYERQVRDSALPAARITPSADLEAFGGGQSFQQATNAIQSYVLEEKKKADDIATTDAYAKAVQARNKLVNDPTQGLITLKGKNAIGASEKYGEMFNKEMDSIEGGLSNEDQRLVFRKIRQTQSLDFNNDVQRHVYGETQRYDQETTISAIAASKDDAVQNYMNPGKVTEAIKIQGALMDAFGARNGMPIELVEQKKREAISNTHADVINRMINSDQDKLAKAYFDEVKTALTGDDASKIEKVLHVGSLRGEAQRQEDTIIASSKSLTDGLEKARAIEDPELRDEVVSRIKTRFAEQKAIAEQTQEQNFQRAADILETTKSKNKIPASLWASLSLSERNAIDSRARQLVEGVSAKTDYSVYDKLSRSASNDPNGFSKINLLQYRSKLSDSDLEKFIDLQRSVRDKKTGWESKQDGFRTEYQIASGMAAKMKIKDESKNDFYSAIESAKREFMDKNKREPQRAEFQKIVDDIAINKVFVSKIGFDSEKPVYALTEDERRKAYVPYKNIPQNAVSKIKQLAMNRGTKLTSEKVEQIYAASLLNDDARIEELLK